MKAIIAATGIDRRFLELIPESELLARRGWLASFDNYDASWPH
jgi:hypothetical protein